jgi:hypothetical protein
MGAAGVRALRDFGDGTVHAKPSGVSSFEILCSRIMTISGELREKAGRHDWYWPFCILEERHEKDVTIQILSELSQ